jgi:hypothetical protein
LGARAAALRLRRAERGPAAGWIGAARLNAAPAHAAH